MPRRPRQPRDHKDTPSTRPPAPEAGGGAKRRGRSTDSALAVRAVPVRPAAAEPAPPVVRRPSPNADTPPTDEQAVEEFRAGYPFALDPFQEEAIAHLASGESVMVAAPTGTGKTVVAEFGVFRAVRQGFKVMYTTPIKALSNQKFRDLRELYGDKVGLLTGDIIENPGGDILVMTTEVLRNMLLQTPSALWGVGCIIFDEIHYLADPERGTTWEESIIMAPKYVQLVCLSATVSNAPEIAEWIARTHAPIHLITHLQRAVPLSLYYFLDGQMHLVINPRGQQIADFKVGGEIRRKQYGSRNRGPALEEDRPGQERPEPSAREIVESLERADLLPAIYFLFSRRDCEAAAEVCAMMRLQAVRDPATMRRINDVLASFLERLSPEDRTLEQVRTVVYLARRGFGFHHAGLLPILKQLVEELFSKALMRVVFATDTLALGINMPARTVVIGRMSKYDGVSRRILIPNEFQQMAGRAGRRGIDAQGHVVIPYSPWVTFHEAINIATGPLRPVESGFTMRYNSVLNLWDPPAGDRALTVMRSSLLQFQQGRRLRDLEQELDDVEDELLQVPVGCLIGYENGEELLDEYERLGRVLDEARRREKKAEQNVAYVEAQRDELPWKRPEREFLRREFRALLPGSLVHLGAGAGGADSGWAIYLGRGIGSTVGLMLVLREPPEGAQASETAPHHWEIVAMAEYRQVDYLPAPAVTVPLPEALTTLAVPPTEPLDHLLSPQEATELLDEVARARGALPDLQAWIDEHRAEQGRHIEAASTKARANLEEVREEARRAAEAERVHVCHACPVRKEHRSNRRARARLLIDRDVAERRLSDRRRFEENRLQNTLRGLANVLVQFNYLRKGELTYKAHKLADIFDTNALMITEMIEGNYLEGLKPEDLAEVFSWFSYDREIDFLNKLLLPRYLINLRHELDNLQNAIFSAERRQDLSITRGYNQFFFGAARAWCKGTSIADLLSRMELSEGDLVMTFNKTLDLMRQVREMFAHQERDNPLKAVLDEADRMMRRGVVEMAYSIGFAGTVVQGAGEASPEAEPPVEDWDEEAAPGREGPPDDES